MLSTENSAFNQNGGLFYCRYQSPRGHKQHRMRLNLSTGNEIVLLCVFENDVVWMDENDTKTLVWMQIFCSVFDKVKTMRF